MALLKMGTLALLAVVAFTLIQSAQPQYGPGQVRARETLLNEATFPGQGYTGDRGRAAVLADVPGWTRTYAHAQGTRFTITVAYADDERAVSAFARVIPTLGGGYAGRPPLGDEAMALRDGDATSTVTHIVVRRGGMLLVVTGHVPDADLTLGLELTTLVARAQLDGAGR